MVEVRETTKFNILYGGSSMSMGVCGHKVLSLDGVWDLSHNKIGTSTYEEGIKQEVIPCAVPGDVHLAFMDAGIIKDPAFGLNSK